LKNIAIIFIQLPAMFARHFLISGVVQGVGFRYNTCAQAMHLNLRGWVRNLLDGQVEVWAEGEMAALDELAAWLAHGPSGAQVKSLTAQEGRPVNYLDFSERPTSKYSEQVLT
jgi:acylphosphatase